MECICFFFISVNHKVFFKINYFHQFYKVASIIYLEAKQWPKILSYRRYDIEN